MMARIVNKKELQDFMGAHYERNFKTAYMLLGAHSAALVSCATFLKDYAQTPAYKGIGIFVLIFGIGFICALIHYAGLFMARAVVMNSLQSDEDPNNAASAGFLKLTVFASMAAAVLLLVAAVGLFVWKIASL
jgi:hypothetical protein